MNISEIKDLLAQFDASTLREFSYKNNGEELNLSKNQTSSVTAAPVAPTVEVVAPAPQAPVAPVAAPAAVETPATPVEEASAPPQAAEGEVVESPLVGVAYLSPSPEKPAQRAVLCGAGAPASAWPAPWSPFPRRYRRRSGLRERSAHTS